MTIDMIRHLIVMMHVVQHEHLRHPLVWVGCTRGWQHSCLKTVVVARRGLLEIRW